MHDQICAGTGRSMVRTLDWTSSAGMGALRTLEEAKAQLAENWRKWLTWAKLGEKH